MISFCFPRYLQRNLIVFPLYLQRNLIVFHCDFVLYLQDVERLEEMNETGQLRKVLERFEVNKKKLTLNRIFNPNLRNVSRPMACSL